jgi:hypothetical protein
LNEAARLASWLATRDASLEINACDSPTLRLARRRVRSDARTMASMEPGLRSAEDVLAEWRERACRPARDATAADAVDVALLARTRAHFDDVARTGAVRMVCGAPVMPLEPAPLFLEGLAAAHVSAATEAVLRARGYRVARHFFVGKDYFVISIAQRNAA